MNRFNAAALCLLLAAGCKGSGPTTTPSGLPPIKKTNEATFITGARFIPGDGSPVIENATIIIDDEGKIYQVGVGKELEQPKGSLRRDFDGQTIIPMMFNLNAYPGLSLAGQKLNAKNYTRESLVGDLNRYAYYGVAAVAAGGDSEGLASTIRDEQRADKLTGALLHTAGRGIAAKGGSGVLGSVPVLVTSEEEGRKAVTELADRKVDLVMLWANGMKGATSAAIIDEAHKHKLKVFADAPSLSEAKDVVKAGVDALVGSVREGEVDDELITLLKEKKIPLAPSLSSLEARFVYLDKPKWRGERLMLEVYKPKLSAHLVDPDFLAIYKRESDPDSFRRQFETASKNLKKLADGGVTIAFGSGSGLPYTFPGYFEHHELELMVAAGLSPMDALKAASLSSAAALGAADLGALTPGKKANFMIISEDPLKEISATKALDEVWINGKQVDRQTLTRNFEVKVEEITAAQRQNNQNIEELERIRKAEERETHYGPFVLAKPATTVAPGLVVQTPRRSKVATSGGPPYRVTVSMSGASAEDFRAFYAATLKSWTSAGGCWEKPVPGASTKFRLCAEPSAGQVVLNITVQ